MYDHDHDIPSLQMKQSATKYIYIIYGAFIQLVFMAFLPFSDRLVVSSL